MELAIAVNDDIHITSTRFKALQKNKKPYPFILTELTSDILKEQERKEQMKIEKSIKESSPKKQEPAKVEAKKVADIDIMDMAPEPKKEQPPSLSDNLMDLNIASEPQPPPPMPVAPATQPEGGNIFELLGSAMQSNPGALSAVSQPPAEPNPLFNTNPNPSIPVGVTLSQAPPAAEPSNLLQSGDPMAFGELNNPNAVQADNFGTDADLKKEEKSNWDHLTDLSDIIKK